MTHPRDCPICGGSQTIRLPVRQRISAVRPAEYTQSTVEASVRTYPCPECATSVPLERVQVIEEVVKIDERYVFDGNAMGHAKEMAIRYLGAALVKGGFVTLETGRVDRDQMSMPVYIRLGVVSKAAVASIEERIAQRQEEIAREVVAEAVENLAMGGRGGLAGIVRDALPVVMDRRKRQKMEKPE